MPKITTSMIMDANQQAYSAISEARRDGYRFTMITIMYGNGTAYINGARSFENARQYVD